MQTEPQATAFGKRYARGEAQVVWTTLVSDLETPVSAFLKIASGRPMSFLLESVEGGAVRGRYSIIGLDPDRVWRSTAGRAEINRRARQERDAFVFGKPDEREVVFSVEVSDDDRWAVLTAFRGASDRSCSRC